MNFLNIFHESTQGDAYSTGPLTSNSPLRVSSKHYTPTVQIRILEREYTKKLQMPLTERQVKVEGGRGGLDERRFTDQLETTSNQNLFRSTYSLLPNGAQRTIQKSRKGYLSTCFANRLRTDTSRLQVPPPPYLSPTPEFHNVRDGAYRINVIMPKLQAKKS